MFAWLAFVGAALVLLGALLNLTFRAVALRAERPMQETPTEITAIKIAYYVPPTDTPTLTPTATRLPTRTPTRTLTPTKKPTATIAPSQTPTVAVRAAVAVAPSTTPTSIPPTVVPPPQGNGDYKLLSAFVSADRPRARPADLNLTLRGFQAVSATLGLVDYTGETDLAAPQLAGLFSDNRTASITAAYQVFDWNASCDCRGALVAEPDVSLIGVAVSTGENLRVPLSGYYIGADFQTLVLFADAERIVLKYTRSDSVVDGYALHVEGIAVDGNLLALYQQANNAGRGELPALRAGQSIGKAKGNELKIAIRDCGAFMDPRSRKDWWRGR